MAGNSGGDVFAGAAQGAAQGSVLGFWGVAAGAVIGAAGALLSNKSKKKAAAAQREAAAEDIYQAGILRNQTQAENMRRAKQTVREALIAQGAVTNFAASRGVISSSGAIAGMRDPIARANSNVRYMERQELGQQQIFASQQKQAALGERVQSNLNKAANWETVGKVGNTILDAGGGWARLFNEAGSYFKT